MASFRQILGSGPPGYTTLGGTIVGTVCGVVFQEVSRANTVLTAPCRVRRGKTNIHYVGGGWRVGEGCDV